VRCSQSSVRQYIPVAALLTHPTERGCWRFSAFTTTACP
jgi:hypothetical protein